MLLLRRVLQAVAVAAVLLPSMLAAPAALAGEAEIALLQSYIGNWRGSGVTVGGAEPEPFTCRMQITKGNLGKINYAGRCSLYSMNLSVAGTLAYIDAASRYEAAMTSNANFRGTAIGRQQGDSIVFTITDRWTDQEGNDRTMTSSVQLQGGGITVAFNVVFNNTGERFSATVPFSRQAITP